MSRAEAAEAECRRRAALGEPVVRDHSRQSLRRGWIYVCPWPEDLCGIGSMHDGHPTAEDCYTGWVQHATTRHPGRPISWPAGTPGSEPLPEPDQLTLWEAS